MPAISVDAADVAELAEMLQFVSGWLAAEQPFLGASLTRFVGSDAYDLSQLRADLARFVFLLDGSGGESLFLLGNGDC
jgi:hypothetical protein